MLGGVPSSSENPPDLSAGSVKEQIEWFTPQEKKPDEFAPILVRLPSEEPFPEVREAYYLVIDGIGAWNVVHPMLGGFVKEEDIALWAYMPKGKQESQISNFRFYKILSKLDKI